MGVWTVPWENEAKAKEFASKIKEGIHVKIEKSPLGELVIISDEISFRFDQEALFGSDELTDLIYDEATENEVQNFNITKLTYFFFWVITNLQKMHIFKIVLLVTAR